MIAHPLKKVFLIGCLFAAVGFAGIQALDSMDARSRSFKRVILIAVDTLRVDHVSAFGYHRPTTPHLERLLTEEAIGFDAAYAPSSWTLPSSVSLMTSLPANLHQVEDRNQTLHPSVPTLAAAFSRGGWRSAAFVTHIYVSSLFGIDSGFDEFHELSIDWSYGEGQQLRADQLNERVLPWLTENRDARFFLYLHYFDPHWDYDPPAPYDAKFTDPSYKGEADGTWKYLSQFLPSDRRMSDADLAHVIGLYDGEIAFTDFQLNRLFDHLKAHGMWEDTLLVILSDHGEELQDHGSVHHIRTLYEEVLRVPLIVKLPGGRPGSWQKRVQARVSTMDVAPTLLDLARIDIPETFQGKSLVPLMRRPGKDREVFARTMRHDSDKMALIRENMKLIEPFGRNTGRRLLFDLEADPRERESVTEEFPDMVKKMTLGLDRITALSASEMGLPGAGAEARLTDEQEALLKALGYMNEE